MQTVNTAFPDEETFQNIDEDCLENIPMPTEAVKNSYEDMYKAFDKYIAAVERKPLYLSRK